MKDENECVFGGLLIHVCLCTVCVSVLFIAGFCDFEMDFCGWVNNPPAESGVDWDWLTGTTGGNLNPDKDHSTDTDLGKSPCTFC